MSDKLYKVTRGNKNVVYANYLTVDSDGNWVMEGKSGEGVFCTSKDNVEEVLPHTISVQYLGTTTKEYSFKSEKDKYKVGDVLWIRQDHGDAVVIVTEVDTKSKSATKDIDVRAKFVTESV